MKTRAIAQFAAIREEIASGNLNVVLTRYSDLVLVACIALMVGLMLVPLPTFLLDIFLTINITMAVTVLMVSIYISNATQIASYPTVLLITTLYRLSLDISATRLILLKADAGEVIRAFGMFVVGGNFVVGAVIFLIITLVQFIVITKGAERVAEVAARFTLDAMPGKQMSIDADMRSGIIDSKEGRRRRYALSRESQFYGAMDGAMKFVKGDAIASIIITVVNIAGGLVIGVAMNGMSPVDAVQTYSILTIGNGLVSQIPALLISISAGMVVTRVASEDEKTNLGRDIAGQILSQPKAIAVVSAILFVMALVPGLPKIPFFLLSLITGALAYGLFRSVSRKEALEAEVNPRAVPVPKGAEPQVLLTVPTFLHTGPDLLPYIDLQTLQGQSFFEKVTRLRHKLYLQTGIIFPELQVLGNLGIQEHNYAIWLNEVPVSTGRIPVESLLMNASVETAANYGIAGQPGLNPATGTTVAWISREQADAAKAAGFQTYDTHEVLVLHLANFFRKHAVDFVGVQEVFRMLAAIRKYYPNLIEEIMPRPVSLQQLTEILKLLVQEEVSIRDLKTILECLGEWAKIEPSTPALAERVRTVLRRKICYSLTEGKPLLFVYQLDPMLEDLFRNSIRQNATGSYLAMDPESISIVLQAAQREFEDLPSTAQRPVIVTFGDIRRFVRKLIGHNFPNLQVLSYEELTPDIHVQSMGMIGRGAGEQIASGALVEA